MRMHLLSLLTLQAGIMTAGAIQTAPSSSVDVQCPNDDGHSSTRTTVLARTSWKFYGGASAATGRSTSISYTPLSSRTRPQQQGKRHLSKPRLLLHKIIADPPSSPSSRLSPTPARASIARAPIHPSPLKNGSTAQQPISSATQFHPPHPRYRHPRHFP